MRDLLEHEDDPKEIFVALAGRDIGEGCDLMRKVWDEGRGLRGYVSMEVDPTLAGDTEGTIAEARRFHALIDKPNLYVKIPATKEGLPAIEEMIAAGKSINVTLIFSLQRHREVMEAYIRGIERLVGDGGDPAGVASVASFFVSRVDTEADKRLDAIGGHDDLKGRLAVANAKLAYAELEGALLRRALGGARDEGRVEAVVPLGVDLDEEPGVPGRPLRRGADRPRHREHDARGDDRGVPGPR